MKKVICPVCEKEVEVEPIKKTITVKVRKENIEIPVTFFKCKECGYDEIEDRENPIDELDLAYREYRKRHGMLQPEEITQLRKQYGLSQRELAKILGLSPATLSRYETGGLQEPAHDYLLQMLKKPENMLEILNKNKELLKEKKIMALREILLNKINNKEKEKEIEERHNIKSETFRGNRKFSVERFKDIVYCIINRMEQMNYVVNKTKLNKLLFYTDFLHFREFGVSLTGAAYAKLPYGPCPDDFQHLLDLMEKENIIVVKEFYHPIGNEEIAESRLYTPASKREILLSQREKEFIDFVVKTIGSKKASELSDLSHKEKAYKETEDYKNIDYRYAKDIIITNNN